MKSIIQIYLFPFLLTFLFFSCSPKLITDSSLNNENSLIGMINEKIASREITREAIFVVNKEEVNLEEIIALNECELTDFQAIDFYNKKEGIETYGGKGKHGVVIITPYLDENFSLSYYQKIDNPKVNEFIKTLNDQGLIKKNPLIIITGIPLLRSRIYEELNRLGENGIEKITLLDRKTGYGIYGIRAINGVLFVDPKY